MVCCSECGSDGLISYYTGHQLQGLKQIASKCKYCGTIQSKMIAKDA